MKTYNNSVVLRNDGTDPSTSNDNLNAGVGVNITVRVASTPTAGQGALASIFDVADVTIGNPMQTDSQGNYTFKVADGLYDVVIAEGTADETILASEEVVELVTPDFINNLSLPYVFDTVADMVASTIVFPVGKIIKTKERSTGNGGGGDYVKISGTGTANTYNIIASATTSSSFVLREDGAIYANQYNDNTTDIGAAWNFADARANTEGWPLVLPAGNFNTSISLAWDGIFHGVKGAGRDLTIINFTTDVQGMRIRGGNISGFQLVGVGATATQVGIVIDQNQAHTMKDVRVKGFYDNFEFNGGNASNFDDIFGDDSVRHSWNNTVNTPDSNSITCGNMNFKGAGGTAFNFESGTPPNVSQQWKGGIILVQQSNQGFNISGRGHDLSFYSEFNTNADTLDANCKGSQIRLLYSEADPIDSGLDNEVILHRTSAAEGVLHQKLEAKKAIVRDRGFSGQFSLSQTSTRTMTISEDGSGSEGALKILSLSAPALNVDVSGRITSQIIDNTNNSALLTVSNGNVVRVTNTSPTTITSIVASEGQTYTLVFLDSNTTIQNAVQIQLAGGANFSPVINSTLTMVYTGTAHYEVSRSVN